MKTFTLFKTLLIAVMGFGLFACSSDDDEPKAPETENPGSSDATESKYVSAADFETKVKGRIWVFDDRKTVMSDGKVIDATILNYMVGDTRHIDAFSVGEESASTFWHPTLGSAGWHYNSRTVYSYTYDEETGHLDMNGGKWGNRLMTLLSVDEEKIVYADHYGITPKDFDPELYNDHSAEVNDSDLDPDSYIQYTYRLATAEEEAEYWKEYQENP